MSKQDRQGVRTPADIERKYNLGALSKSTGSSEQLSQINQMIAQFMAATNAKITELFAFMVSANDEIADLTARIEALESTAYQYLFSIENGVEEQVFDINGEPIMTIEGYFGQAIIN